MFIAVALVAAIVIADQNSEAGADEGLAANWSRWQPSDTTIEGGASEIAEHVGAEYTHPDGKQLVAGQGRRSRRRFRSRCGRPAGRSPTSSGNTRPLPLDGLGANGSIKGGTPSESTR